jgi:hypothetical protein
MNKTIILTLLVLSTLFIFGCSSPKGDDVCNNACIKEGFVAGNCETLSVMPNPCETKLNLTTITSQESYCEEYGKDQVSWFAWNVEKVRVDGVGNMCCCS